MTVPVTDKSDILYTSSLTDIVLCCDYIVLMLHVSESHQVGAIKSDVYSERRFVKSEIAVKAMFTVTTDACERLMSYLSVHPKVNMLW